VNSNPLQSKSLGRRILFEAGVLVLAAMVTAVAVNALRPDALPWFGWRPAQEAGAQDVRTVTPREALEIQNADDALFIDARDTTLFQQGRIPDAINIPSTVTDDALAKRMQGVSENKPIVIYCEGQLCQAAAELSARLAAMGFGAVMYMPKGLEGWVMAGGELEAGP
jgi:rhodanese-related sulfurtransferase